MPNTKITKEKLKNHWAYSKKIYLFLTLVAVGISSIIYTVANNRTPADYKYVGIAFVAGYSDVTPLEGDIALLTEKGRAYDENLEEVGFMSINYSGEVQSELDAYGSEVYVIQLSAGDSDIFIQPPKLAKQNLDEGGLVPLDTLPAFELISKDYPDAIVWTEEEATVADDDGNEIIEIERHAYSLDVSSLTKLRELNVYAVDGMYASVLRKSANPDTSLYILYEMFNLYTQTETE